MKEYKIDVICAVCQARMFTRTCLEDDSYTAVLQSEEATEFKKVIEVAPCTECKRIKDEAENEWHKMGRPPE